MTPKEKAKELVDKFRKIYIETDIDFETDEQKKWYLKDYESKINNPSKQCALICVDEVIKSLNNIEGQHSTIYEEEDFYKEVKQEIEKL